MFRIISVTFLVCMTINIQAMRTRPHSDYKLHIRRNAPYPVDQRNMMQHNQLLLRQSWHYHKRHQKDKVILQEKICQTQQQIKE